MNKLHKRHQSHRVNIYETDFTNLPRFHDSTRKSMTFVQALRPILIFGQIFGMLPFDGIMSDNIEDVKFRLRSPKVVYSIILQALCFAELLVFVINFNSPTTFQFFNLFLSYSVGLFATVYLLFQARKWKTIIKFWSENEEIFLYPPYSNRARAFSFERNVKAVAAVIVGYTIIDHFFRMSSELYRGYLKHKHCFGEEEEFWPTATLIYADQRSIVFKVIKFDYWYIPLFEWIHISRRASWGFGEVLIIAFAMDLSMKFKLFNGRLLRVRHQTLWSSYWKDMYEHYAQLCSLVEKGNELISPLLIFITFTDFFFLCERLFSQYAAHYDTFGRFHVSLLGMFFFVRSFLLFHFCSKINTSSREPLKTLRDAPMRNWTIDLQRLTELVEDRNRGFTGMNFFLITKGFIISFLGTVTTYQLVVMQKIIATPQNILPVDSDEC